MKRGFLSFVVAAFFLLSFLSAALIVSSAKPDYSYEGYRSFLVFEVSAKRAFYSAIGESASQAWAASFNSRAGAKPAVEKAAFARALEFDEKMHAQGCDALLWCGLPTEQERISASEEMQKLEKALLPNGALPIISCESSFQADTLNKKLHLSNLGISIYCQKPKIGKAAQFPSQYEVSFS